MSISSMNFFSGLIVKFRGLLTNFSTVHSKSLDHSSLGTFRNVILKHVNVLSIHIRNLQPFLILFYLNVFCRSLGIFSSLLNVIVKIFQVPSRFDGTASEVSVALVLPSLDAQSKYFGFMRASGDSYCFFPTTEGDTMSAREVGYDPLWWRAAGVLYLMANFVVTLR